MIFARRTFLTGALAMAALGCRRRKVSGYSGYAFIANREGQAIAAVDLDVFEVARHIHIDGGPADVLADQRRQFVYALTPENGCVHQIRADTLSFWRKVSVGGSAVSMRLSPGGSHLYVICRQPRKIAAIALDSWRVEWQAGLPADPFDFDVDRSGQYIAISYGAAPLLHLFAAANRNPGRPMETGSSIGTVRFEFDSRALIAGNLSERMLSVYQVPDPQLIVKLPLSVRPDHFCFNSNHGQLFITGEGSDAVVVVYPYYTPQVGATVLAGHAPGAMAATLSQHSSPQYLFVANPKSGDVTIFDIDKQRVVAVTPVGTDPCYITITPDDQYALVLNQGSGDLAVIRIANIARAVADFAGLEKARFS